MLDVFGGRYGRCDGVSRRSFLRVGALGLGGLALPDLLRGPNRPGLPSYVALPRAPSFGQAAYLGPGYNPFSIDGDPAAGAKVRDLDRPPGLSLDRLDDRRDLLARLDRLERARDASGM